MLKSALSKAGGEKQNSMLALALQVYGFIGTQYTTNQCEAQGSLRAQRMKCNLARDTKARQQDNKHKQAKSSEKSGHMLMLPSALCRFHIQFLRLPTRLLLDPCACGTLWW